MPTSNAVFHLYIPQLLQSLSSWNKDFLFEAESAHLSSLLSLLEETIYVKVQGLDVCFFTSLNQSVEELPIAYYRYQVEKQEYGDRVVANMMCADPVNFEVSMNDITLSEKVIDLTDEESQELISILNQYFEEDDLEFHFGSNGSWYVSYPANEQVSSTPIDEVLKQNIAGKLAYSKQRNWKVVQNEVQMLLHGSDVNKHRDIAGLTPVNSVWFWGAGQPQSNSSHITKVYTSLESSIKGQTFARAAKCEWGILPEQGEMLLKDAIGTNVLILDQLFLAALESDLDAFQHELSKLDETYIKPLLDAWKRKEIDIVIDCCDGRIFKPLHSPSWKFWHKPKSLLDIAL